ncbi:MAG: thioredoxin [Saprospiraceae bacterium]
MFWNKKEKHQALEITDATFNDIIETDQGILLDFYAEWCGPCKVLSPIVNELSEQFSGRAVVGKVNVDTNPKLTAFFKIKSMPTLVFVKHKKLIEQISGLVPKPNLEEMVEDLIAFEFPAEEEE